MPIYNEQHKNFYTTRAQTLKIFRDEEKKICTCRIEVWAGNENKLTCLNCIRKSDLKEELERKGFWKVFRRQGQYKQLKIAPVYPQFC